MADQDRPNQAASRGGGGAPPWKKDKAEGSRPQEAGRGEATPPDTDTAGGISNRSLDEEVRNRERVPERGETKGDVEQPAEGIERE
jgi:hypothetical protein